MVPATGRESDARRVCFKEEDRTRWTSPGAWRSINGDTAYGRRSMKDQYGLVPKYGQSSIQYLWRYIPCAETSAACSNDEVYRVWLIIDPGYDRLTNELRVIGDDFGAKDLIPAGLEEVDCGGAGLVEEIISGGCIAHGQDGCGHHGFRGSGCAGVPGSTDSEMCSWVEMLISICWP